MPERRAVNCPSLSILALIVRPPWSAVGSSCARTQRARDLEQELAHGRRGVDVLLIEVEIDARGLKHADRGEQIDERAAEAIDRARHDGIELAALGIVEQGLVAALRAADAC